MLKNNIAYFGCWDGESIEEEHILSDVDLSAEGLLRTIGMLLIEFNQKQIYKAIDIVEHPDVKKHLVLASMKIEGSEGVKYLVNHS